MSKKTAVVYASRNGSTRRYAEWIARDSGGKLIPLEEADVDELAAYDTLVYGGCVYAGNIRGISLIKNNRELLKNVQLVVFAVGLTQPGDEVAFQEVLDRNFTQEEREGIQFFHFPGALDYQKMGFGQKLMLRVLKKSIEKKPENLRSQMETYLLESFGGKLDFVNHSYIKPLIQFLNSKENAGEER